MLVAKISLTTFLALVEIDAEELIKRDPEVIIRGTWINGFKTDNETELSSIRDEIMSRPELAGVSAVKTGRVYVRAEGIPTGLLAQGSLWA